MDDSWLIPQPRLIEVAPAGSPHFVLSPGIAITISHRAERGERVAARQLQRALRGCSVDAPSAPQSGAGALDRSILLDVRDRDEPAFGAAPALVSGGPDGGVPADPAQGGSASPLPEQAAQTAKPPATTHVTRSREKAGQRPESPLAGATEAYILIVEATRVTLWAAEADLALSAIRLLAKARAVPMPDEAGFAALGEAERASMVARRQGPRAIAGETLRRMETTAEEAAALLAPPCGCDDEADRTLAECLLAARQIAHAACKALLGRRVAEAVAREPRRSTRAGGSATGCAPSWSC